MTHAATQSSSRLAAPTGRLKGTSERKSKTKSKSKNKSHARPKTRLTTTFLLLLTAQTAQLRPVAANCHYQEIRPETPEIQIDCCGYGPPLAISKIVSSKDDGMKLEEEYIYKSRNSADQIYDSYKNLWIRNPNGPGITSSYKITSDNYNGSYSCKHETSDGKILTNNVDIMILEPPGKPRCDFPLGRILEANSSVEFSCASRGGSPLPKYDWWQNGMRINLDQRKDLKIRFEKGKSLLSIAQVDQRHSGTWYCTAKNFVTPNDGRENFCTQKTFELGAFSTATIIYIVGISVPSAVFIILTFMCLFGCLFKRLRKRSRFNREQNGESISSTSKSSFLTTFCSCCCYTDSEDEYGEETAGDVLMDEPALDHRNNTGVMKSPPRALPRHSSAVGNQPAQYGLDDPSAANRAYDRSRSYQDNSDSNRPNVPASQHNQYQNSSYIPAQVKSQSNFQSGGNTPNNRYGDGANMRNLKAAGYDRHQNPYNDIEVNASLLKSSQQFPSLRNMDDNLDNISKQRRRPNYRN